MQLRSIAKSEWMPRNASVVPRFAVPLVLVHIADVAWLLLRLLRLLLLLLLHLLFPLGERLEAYLRPICGAAAGRSSLVGVIKINLIPKR